MAYNPKEIADIQTSLGTKASITAMNNRVPQSRTINGVPLTGDIIISRRGQVLLDFGSTETDIVIVTVPATWVATTSFIRTCPAPIATADHDPDDYIAEELISYYQNIVVGVSFDIVLHAPNNSFGKYYVNYSSN